MAKKAKIVFVNDTCVIADKTVEEVKTLLASSDGLVEIPVSGKVYDYKLNTINIGEKTVPAYTVETTKKLVNPTTVARVEEADIEFAKVYTGTGEVK